VGTKKYPVISQADFAKILRAIFGREPDRTKGDHEKWFGAPHDPNAWADNDTGCDPVYDWVIPATIEKCKVTREQFYGLRKATAKAANCPYLKDGLSLRPATN